MAGPEKTYGLSSADVRKLRDISKRVLGGGGSRRPPPTRRRRGPGGGGRTTEFAYLIKDMPARETVLGVRLRNAPGYAAEAVVPLTGGEDDDGLGIFDAVVEDEEADPLVMLKLDAINPWWPTEIKAGLGDETDAGPPAVYARQPVLVRGYRRTWMVPAPEPEDEEDPEEGTPIEKSVFVIEDVCYPFTICKGLTVGAVTGAGTIDVDNVELLWGRDPRHDATDAAEVVEVELTESWTSDDNAYCLFIEIQDGTLLMIDLRCPAE